MILIIIDLFSFGDRQQSIYAFNGADVHAVDNIKKVFKPISELPLDICYRCPENVVRLVKDLVPEISWNKAREDKGVVKFVKMKEVLENIRAGDVIIGRRNRDLVKIFKKFTLEYKKPLKFKNDDLVNSIIRSIEQTITEYLRRFIKGLNVYQKVDKYMKNWIIENGITSLDNEEYKEEKQKQERLEIDKNSGQSKRHIESNITIDFLVQAMKDYKKEGTYKIDEDNDDLKAYYDIILELLDEYKKVHKSILLEDFKKYIKKFLNVDQKTNNVAIISSIHAMKR